MILNVYTDVRKCWQPITIMTDCRMIVEDVQGWISNVHIYFLGVIKRLSLRLSLVCTKYHVKLIWCLIGRIILLPTPCVGVICVSHIILFL